MFDWSSSLELSSRKTLVGRTFAWNSMFTRENRQKIEKSLGNQQENQTPTQNSTSISPPTHPERHATRPRSLKAFNVNKPIHRVSQQPKNFVAFPTTL
jgi:hypothetical protein